MVYDADADTDLHLLLHSPGGDGETAVRIRRAVQARCKELTVIVPDMAKSAATLIAIGAHRILMGPASDLGPIDPQFFLDGNWVAAKDIIAAVADAARKVHESPDTAPLYASLLSNVDALILQQAHSALDGTGELLTDALRSNPDRSEEVVDKLSASLKEPLITRPSTHSALLGIQDVKAAGLPVMAADLHSEQWQTIWRLWAKYYALGAVVGMMQVYEGQRASHVFNPMA